MGQLLLVAATAALVTWIAWRVLLLRRRPRDATAPVAAAPIPPAPQSMAIALQALLKEKNKAGLPSVPADSGAALDLSAWVNDFPPLRANAERIWQELQGGSPDQACIEKLVCQDPVLALLLLRLANTAAGKNDEITDLEQAKRVLGPDLICGVAFQSSCAALARPRTSGGFDTQSLIRHNLATAELAAAIARRSNRISPAQAYTAALLHDAGKILMHSAAPQLVSELLDYRTNRKDESRLTKEERLFGANHTTLGSLLAAQWQLPLCLVNAIDLHHEPLLSFAQDLPLPDRELISIVFVANQLAKLMGCAGGDPEIDVAPPEVLQVLNLPEKYEDILTLVRPEASLLDQ